MLETVAICEGLRQIGSFCYSNCTLESDCKEVFDQLLAGQRPIGSLGHINQQFLSLMDRQSVVLSFVRHDANISTHLLVAHAISTYSSSV